MSTQIKDVWKDFLNPDVQRPRLILSSIFIATFQSLKEAIIERGRGMFWTGVDETGDVYDPRYQLEVLSRNASPVYASLEWLRDKGAIDAQDIVRFDQIKACRNRLAHELLTVLCGTEPLIDFQQQFGELAALLRKIETWWIMNMEEVDPSVTENDILPGRLISLELLFQISLEGDRSFYEEVEKRSRDCSNRPTG